jgi:hypothetical protein
VQEEESGVVNRRSLKRLREEIVDLGVVVKLQNGKTEVFSEQAPLSLFALQMDESKAAYEGLEPPDPTTSQMEEARRLREALENATPESRADYEYKNGKLLALANVIEKSVQKYVSGA